jgi:hypothetical protein
MLSDGMLNVILQSAARLSVFVPIGHLFLFIFSQFLQSVKNSEDFAGKYHNSSEGNEHT